MAKDQTDETNERQPVAPEVLPPLCLILTDASGGSKLVFTGMEAKVLLHVGVNILKRQIGNEPEGKGGFSWSQRDDTVSSWWDLKDRPSRGSRHADDDGP